MNKIIGFIPSRYNSTRFPGKPMVIINGKTMIQRVYEQAKKCSILDEVIVLTDDERIYNHVKNFGEVKMTSSKCTNGTNRILSIIDTYPSIDGFINIQGDEPFIDPQQIETIAIGIKLHKNPITTLKYKTISKSDFNEVKVVCDNNDKALYFSRSLIPCNAKSHFLHVGIYGFNASVIPKLKELNKSRYGLDTFESLEQLLWMVNGIDVYAYTTNKKTISVDTPEDLEKIEKTFRFRKV